MGFTLVPVEPTGRGSRILLEEIDTDVVTAVQEAYVWGKTHPGKLEIDFGADTAETGGQNAVAAARFIKHARDYVYQNEPRLVVDGYPTRKNEVRFRVDLYVAPTPAEEAAAA
jgi:hypothetical protein